MKVHVFKAAPRRFLAVWTAMFCASAGIAASAPAVPAAVPGFVAPQPGEHPRLFFRKGQLPEIQRRASTPEGQAIVQRLRFLLDGANGDTLPTVFNPQRGPQPDGAGAFNDTAPLGKTFTSFHAAGFGLLYLLTGEKKYADLGRQCTEWMLEGRRDRDNRYSFRQPTGALRSGPSLAAMAMAYDLCHDGWPEDFRLQIAKALEGYNEGPNMSFAELVRGSRHKPGSNHWGPQIGGGALGLLAILGDPGVDHAKLRSLRDDSTKAMVRQMQEGWGDYGCFAEGDGPGCISSDTALVPALQAWRVAGGKDFISGWPNVQWMTLKWVMGTLPPGGNNLYPKRGGYPHNVWARNGMSGTGAFAQGFGAIEDKYKPALLWLYNHTFREADAKAGQPFDTAAAYPHRAILALVNWPFDAREQNPAEVLPQAVMDTYAGHAIFRNRWQDGDDILVTAMLNDTKGNGATKGGPIFVWAFGEQATFPVTMRGQPTHFAGDKNGGLVSNNGASLALDFTGKTGADAAVVLAITNIRGTVKTGASGRGRMNTQSLVDNGVTFVAMTISKNARHPDLKTVGGKVTLGTASLTFDGKNVSIEK